MPAKKEVENVMAIGVLPRNVLPVSNFTAVLEIVPIC
jgi:hypothetical protein